MEKALKTMIDNMPEKTGKSLKEWKSLLKLKSFTKHSEAVNFLKKEVYITFSNTATTFRKIVELLASIGYNPAINLSDLDAPKKQVVDKRFYYQLGIAGFAFGNIMLLSLPEYFGLTESTFREVFGYLNILLILPVVFYSGRDYLTSAWQGLRQQDHGAEAGTGRTTTFCPDGFLCQGRPAVC